MIPNFKRRVAAALPAVLFSLCHEYLREKGYVVREDMDVLVTRALRAAVKGLEPNARNMVLDRAAEEGSQILRAPNCDTAPALWVSLAHALLVAVDRGVLVAEDIMLIATAVETELIDHADEFGGLRSVQRSAALIDNVAWSRGWWKAPTEKGALGA
mgnify:CR=1 FL=1